jgi:polysaccharide biosynthesis transport protein
VRLNELRREAETNRTLYEGLLARYKETRAQETLELPDSRIVTTADAPTVPSFPKTTLTLGLAVILGFGLGCLLALAVDYFDRRIKTYEQVKAVSGLRGLAAIPLVSARELARLAKRGRPELEHYDPQTARLLPLALQPPLMRYAIEEPASSFAEAVRGIRFALRQVARQRPVDVVMVTSAVGGEGKTTLAVNLALSMAILGVKTVLVDGDLRNPELTRSLCPSVQSGAIEVAAGMLPLHQAVLLEPSTRLAVLPSPAPDDVGILTEFTSSEGMNDVLKQLREHFDLVIVDAPPILPLVDGRALAEQSDCIVFTVGWDQTPQETLVRAVECLGAAYERVVGTVLTRVDFGRLRFYEPYNDGGYGAPYSYGPAPTREAAI